MSFLKASGLAKSYLVGGNPLPVIRDLDLDVRRGEMVAIVGASGVGKSTLLHVLGGLDRAQSGLVQLGDTRISALDDDAAVQFRNRNIGFVFQFHHLLPEFSALETKERASELLAGVGLGDRLHHRPGMLSGGEQQRVAVARALVMKPALLLADEPTGDLDEITGITLHELLREMHEVYGLTSVIATHNSQLASACDRILRLVNGRLCLS